MPKGGLVTSEEFRSIPNSYRLGVTNWEALKLYFRKNYARLYFTIRYI